MNRVDFPDLDGAGAGFAPGGGSQLLGNPYVWNYAWGVGDASTGAVNVTSWDNAGNSASGPFTITADGVNPIAGSISSPNGYMTAANHDVNFVVGVDMETGVRSWQIQRQSAPLAAGACGAVWSPMTNIGPKTSASPWNDTLALDGFCYRYQLVVWDNVNNSATWVAPETTMIDPTAPNATISPLPLGPAGGTVTFTGTSSDAFSGVNKADLRYTGPVGFALFSWSCLRRLHGRRRGTRSLLACQKVDTIEATITDFAGNTKVVTRTIFIDNVPPAPFYLENYVEVLNPQNQHDYGSIMWFNPALTGSFTVQMHAEDGIGLGVQRVDFPDLDGAASDWNPAGGNDVTGTSNALNSPMRGLEQPNLACRMRMHLTSPATVRLPRSNLALTATHRAAVASASTRSAQCGQISLRPTLTIGFAIGTDAEAGITDWRIERDSTAVVAGACGVYPGSWA